MANKTEERLLSLFNEASGSAQGAETKTSTPLNPSHVDSFSESAKSPVESPSFDASLDSGPGQSYHGTSASSGSSASSGGSSVGSTLESLAGSVFGGALGLVPLVGSVFGLFGGNSTEQPAFQKYEKPPSISFEAADTGGGLVNSGYGQMGLPRLYDTSEADTPTGGAGASAPSTPGSPAASSTPANGGAASAASHQISVNVQAIDAQSFMSYSGEIAKAVRDAMLNLSSINDVVSEL